MKTKQAKIWGKQKHSQQETKFVQKIKAQNADNFKTFSVSLNFLLFYLPLQASSCLSFLSSLEQSYAPLI